MSEETDLHANNTHSHTADQFSKEVWRQIFERGRYRARVVKLRARYMSQNYAAKLIEWDSLDENDNRSTQA